MHNTGSTSYLALPYIGDKVRFVIEMSQDGTLKQSDTQQVMILAKMETDKVEVFIPKFKQEFKTDLGKIVRSLGISGIFTPSKDFSKISDAEIAVSDIIHQAFIQVDEEGTEAAAATVIMMRCLGFVEPSKFVADRPFHFHIVDVANELVLFSGAVVEPQFK